MPVNHCLLVLAERLASLAACVGTAAEPQPAADKTILFLIGKKTEKNGKPVGGGWVFERSGGGRSSATTLGHPSKKFENESFRRMFVNVILWTARMEVPAGAPVNVPADVLALPPAW